MAAATGPRERPIPFTAEMVRAILDGRKTQTRRMVNPQPSAGVRWGTLSGGWEDGHGRLLRNRYGRSGDRLWVRETWMCDEYGRRHKSAGMVHYRADAESMGAWRSPRFMPRWASRITLEVTDIRVERLQVITDTDARAEGVTLPERTVTLYEGMWREEFARLWDHINAKRGYGWDANPWVWVVSFRPVPTTERSAE